jgi:hypothetical protein
MMYNDKGELVNVYHQSLKEAIINYHGFYKPETIANIVGCHRCYVYMIWKWSGLDTKKVSLESLNE